MSRGLSLVPNQTPPKKQVKVSHHEPIRTTNIDESSIILYIVFNILYKIKGFL